MDAVGAAHRRATSQRYLEVFETFARDVTAGFVARAGPRPAASPASSRSSGSAAGRACVRPVRVELDEPRRAVGRRAPPRRSPP